MDDEEDRELQAALALSRGEMVPIVISDSDTDGEGDVQITSSSRARASTSRNSPQASSSAQGHTSASAPPPARSGLASLIPDRAALEAERLARAQKRNRELEQDVSAPSGSSAIGSDTEQAGKRLRTDATPIRGTGGGIRTGTSSGNNDFGGSLGRRDDVKDAGSTRYWDGVTRVSHNIYARSSTKEAASVRFADVLLPTTSTDAGGLRHAVLATYCVDHTWLRSLFPPGENTPPVTLIVDGGGRGGLPAGTHISQDVPGWRLVVPKKDNDFWCMHMKFILLFYEKHMRIAILSGNMVDYDWDRIENTAYIQDFPLLSSATAASSQQQPSEMQAQFDVILRSLSIPEAHPALRELSQYDFSKAEVKLVHSVPGWQKGWESINKNGLGRVGHVVRDLGFAPDALGPVIMEAQGSSMGKYSRKWLETFHLLASGAEASQYLPLPDGKGSTSAYERALGSGNGSVEGSRKQVGGKSALFGGGGDAGSSRASQDTFETFGWPPIKLLFPSERYIMNDNIEGVAGAGTFFGKSEKFDQSAYRHLFHSPVPKRGNFLMHAKSILALLPTSNSHPSSASALASKEVKNGIIKSKGKAKGKASKSGSGSETEEDVAVSKKAKKTPSKTKMSRSGESLAGEHEVDARTSNSKESTDLVGWIYMGSHNFTASAWGNLSMKDKVPQMYTNNWELGLILPVRTSDLSEPSHTHAHTIGRTLAQPQTPSDSQSQSQLKLEKGKGPSARTLISWNRPPKPYEKDDIPWDQFAFQKRMGG